jgi:beta-barrel assembly-enhancing protease
MNVTRLACVAAAISLGLAAAAPDVRADEGIYGSVELRGKEQNDLIDTANQLHDQFERRSVLYGDERVVALVRRVGHSLAPEPTDPYFRYEFYVVRDPSPNAFALPNGSIYVHTGILARLDDSAELAGLLGHEITHVAGHHSIVQFRIKAGQVLDWVFTGGIVTLFTQLKFSRDLEQEADDHAPTLMLAAGYDPHAMPDLMDLLAQDFEGVQPRIATIWTTHPDPAERAASSRALVADMPQLERNDSEFDTVVYSLRAMTVRDYIKDDYPYTAIAVVQDFLEKYPGDLELRMLLGDAWQALGPRAEFLPEDLTNKDKRKNSRQRIFHTQVERNNALLATEAGQAAFAANMNRAREVYEDILARDPGYAVAQRGLGEVYEALGRPREAGRAYLEYVRQVPDALDRPVIIGRLAAIRDRIAKEEVPHGN